MLVNQACSYSNYLQPGRFLPERRTESNNYGPYNRDAAATVYYESQDYLSAGRGEISPSLDVPS